MLDGSTGLVVDQVTTTVGSNKAVRCEVPKPLDNIDP
jgi:hypothetical protein